MSGGVAKHHRQLMIVFFSIFINRVLDNVLIFVKRKYLTFILADERLRYTTKAKFQMIINLKDPHLVVIIIYFFSKRAR